MKYELADLCYYADSRVSIADLDLNTYISTENMLPNKEGISRSAGLPSLNQTQAFQADDVLVSNIRPYFRKIWFADRDGGCSNDVLVLRARENCYPNFLYYLLSDNNFFDYSTATSKGTKMPRGDKGAIMRYAVPNIPMDMQIEIADTLSALDARIAENKKINHRLEQMAQAIFKSWFVDFEPFGGVIPDDWREVPLGELVQSIDNRGKTPPLAPYPTDFPIIDVKALSGNQRIVDFNNCTKFVEAETYDSWFRSGHPKPYDILLSTVGSLAEMKLFFGERGCIAQNVVAFRSEMPLYLYQYLQYIKGDLVSYNIGSVQPSIKVTHIIKHPIIVPADDELRQFNESVQPITEEIYTNHCQSEHLATLRDTLLPRLMSGELSVTDLTDAK